jgi:hypothetical protein
MARRLSCRYALHQCHTLSRVGIDILEGGELMIALDIQDPFLVFEKLDQDPAGVANKRGIWMHLEKAFLI